MKKLYVFLITICTSFLLRSVNYNAHETKIETVPILSHTQTNDQGRITTPDTTNYSTAGINAAALAVREQIPMAIPTRGYVETRRTDSLSPISQGTLMPGTFVNQDHHAGEITPAVRF